MELPVRTLVEPSDVVALRGFGEKSSVEIDMAQEIFEGLEGIVRVFVLEDNFSPEAMAARADILRAEHVSVHVCATAHLPITLGVGASCGSTLSDRAKESAPKTMNSHGSLLLFI